MTELWHWVERIGGGLGALLFLGLVIVYAPVLLRWVGRLFLRGGLALWRLPSMLLAFWHDPWGCLRRGADQSVLFALAIYPFICLLEKVFPTVLPKYQASLTGDEGVAESSTKNTDKPADVVDSQSQLTAHGIWLLAQAVHGFCDQRRYPLWRFSHEKHDESAIAAWHQEFIESLAEWAEVRLSVEEYEASWGSTARVYLSAGEICCAKLRRDAPSRHPWTLALNPQDAFSSRLPGMRENGQVRLGDLLQTRHGVDGLIYRLDKRCVAPYEAIDVPPLANEAARNRMVWTWSNREMHPVALAWPDLSAFQSAPATPSPVLIPRVWGSVEQSWGRLGPLQLLGENAMIVCDETGRAGIVQLMDRHDLLLGDVVGYWVETCRWPYLYGGWPAAGLGGAVFEAAQMPDPTVDCLVLAPDARGEIVCDLIEVFSGMRLNPAGVKILAGTLEREACIAINEALDENSPRRVDQMNLAGQLMHGSPPVENPDTANGWGADNLRWLAILADREGYRPVQCPETGRWGFIGRDGAIAIDPQFAGVGHFHQERARAWLSATSGLIGLIDTTGAWAIAPHWCRIDAQTRRCFVVQDASDFWGAVDAQGTMIVPLKHREHWLQDPWITANIKTRLKADTFQSLRHQQTDELQEEVLIEGIARQWHDSMRLWVKAAMNTPPYTLAMLEGVFDSDARQRDLAEAGIWGLKVRVLHDKTTGILQPKAGEEGWIGTCYPVGLSCFDLSVEAPVCGLAVQPEAVIGVPWQSLTLLRR